MADENKLEQQIVIKLVHTPGDTTYQILWPDKLSDKEKHRIFALITESLRKKLYGEPTNNMP